MTSKVKAALVKAYDELFINSVKNGGFGQDLIKLVSDARNELQPISGLREALLAEYPDGHQIDKMKSAAKKYLEITEG